MISQQFTVKDFVRTFIVVVVIVVAGSRGDLPTQVLVLRPVSGQGGGVRGARQRHVDLRRFLDI